MFNELLFYLTDYRTFLESVVVYFADFSISKAIMSILVFFMLVGIVDKMRGNKKGYGEKFDEGFMAMGPLALAVVGIVSLSPVLLVVLKPIISPVYSLLGASPAMFPSSLLALDMGGYALALQLAGTDRAIGVYSGIIVASMMGITMSFTIPYALTIMKKEDHPLLAVGVLAGIVTMPVGCVLGGLLMNTAGYAISAAAVFQNTLPVILLAFVIAAGLLFFQNATLRIFAAFGNAVTLIITVSPAVAVFQYITGIRLPLFHLMVEPDAVMGMVPLEKGLLLVGQIAIVLIGAFPLIHFLNKVLAKPMNRFGARVGINNTASSALLTQLASSIPVWSVMGDMNGRGKLYNIAFAVSGSFVFGDVLAFVGGAEPAMAFPVIVGKLTAGLLAIWLIGVLPVSKNVEGADES